jgi:hypothetical protein
MNSQQRRMKRNQATAKRGAQVPPPGPPARPDPNAPTRVDPASNAPELTQRYGVEAMGMGGWGALRMVPSKRPRVAHKGAFYIDEDNGLAHQFSGRRWVRLGHTPLSLIGNVAIQSALAAGLLKLAAYLLQVAQ